MAPTFSAPGKDKTVKPILQPYHYAAYMSQCKGTTLYRPLYEMFNPWMKISEAEYDIAAEISGMTQQFIALLDDIMDSCALRRGSPPAYRIYGVPFVVHSAHHLFFAAIRQIMDTYPRHLALEALTDFLFGMGRQFFGTGEELYRRDLYQLCPTEEEYIVSVTEKASSVVVFFLSHQRLFSKEAHAYNWEPLEELFGVFFQIQDDYKSLVDTEHAKLKGFAEDITEGKFSFPMVHYATMSGANKLPLYRTLRKKTDDVTVKKALVGIMQESGSFEYTRNKIVELAEQMQEMIRQLPENPIFTEYLDAMVLDLNVFIA